MLNMMKKLKDAKIMFSSEKMLQSILTKYGSILIAGGSTKKTVNARKGLLKIYLLRIKAP